MRRAFLVVASLVLSLAGPLGSSVAATQLPVPSAPEFLELVGDLNVSSSRTVKVLMGGDGPRKVELLGERSPKGANDWSHEVNLFPYFSLINTTSTSGSLFTVPADTLQAGYDYRFAARQWLDGDGGNPTALSPWTLVSTVASASPVPPYPMTPKGAVGTEGNILRVDNSALPKAGGGAPVTSIGFEIKTLHTPFNSTEDAITRWTATAPYNSSGVTSVGVTTCQNIPFCTGAGNLVLPKEGDSFELRWRARAVSADGTGVWSRWRYFSTKDTSLDYFYIPNRAGSYLAGPAGGDEASGLTASKKYPGVYWFIRDAGGNEDRAKIYAIKIDPTTGRMTNIDGYMTKEIKVTGATNTDWETIEADDQGNLWIGDIGDFYRKDTPGLPEAEATGQLRDRNNTAEPDVNLIKVVEPDPYTATSVAVSKVATFRYPDGKTYNCEAMAWVKNYLYLFTKEQPQKIFRFASYIQTSDNVLTYVADIPSGLDPITDATTSTDLSYLALSTATKKAVVYLGAAAAPTTGSAADTVVKNLMVNQDPSYHYYYRDAAAFQADGTLDVKRPWPGPDNQYRQLTMQIEGIAATPGSGAPKLAMISEFGQHVLFVPPNSSREFAGWTDRSGSGSGLAAGPGAIDHGMLPAGTYLAAGSQWHYNDTGGYPSGFTGPTYLYGTGWKSGYAQLGAGDGDEATVINRSQPWHVTDYFRTPITHDPAQPLPKALQFDLVADDGAVIYLNGHPVVRHNMPSTPEYPTSTTLAASAVTGAGESAIHSYVVYDPPLVPGQNILAAEVHQNDQGSGDTSFDLAVRIPTDPAPANFQVNVKVDSDGKGDLDFTWDAVADAGEYRIERRDNLTETPTWQPYQTIAAPATSYLADVNLVREAADFRIVAVKNGIDTPPTMLRRLAYTTDVNHLVSGTGHLYATYLQPVTAPPPPVKAALAVGTRGLTASGEVALADGPEPGPADVIGTIGFTVTAGLVVEALLTHDFLILDGKTGERHDPAGTGQYPYQQTRDDASDEMERNLAQATSISPSQRKIIVETCLDRVDAAAAINQAPATLGNKANPCNEKPVYLPSPHNLTNGTWAVNMAGPVTLRAAALTVHPDWITERKRAAAASRSWLKDAGWPEGPPGMTSGCIGDTPAGSDCDEFPNAIMVKGGGNSIPRPAVAYVPLGENRREGGFLRNFFTTCNVQPATANPDGSFADDGTEFLVIPLAVADPTAMPHTFAFCNDFPTPLVEEPEP